MRAIKLALASFAVAAAAGGQIQAGIIAVGVSNEGDINNGGVGNGITATNFTSTGFVATSEDRGWLAFDLSGVSGTFSSAELKLTLSEYSASIGIVPEKLSIFDVSASLSDIASVAGVYPSSTLGQTIFGDLGGGNLYGTVTGSNGTYDVQLSAQAVADINAAAGSSKLLFGFKNDTITSGTTSVLAPNHLGGVDTSHVGGTELLLTQSTATTPEPSSLALFGIGTSIMGVAAARRRRRERNLA